MTTPRARAEEARITSRHVAHDRRKHVRVPASAAPLRVQDGAARLDVVDWSPGGLRIAGAPPAADAGLQLAVGDGSFPVRARPVWAAGGEVGLVFTSLPEPARERLVAAILAVPPSALAAGAPPSATAPADPAASEPAPASSGPALGGLVPAPPRVVPPADERPADKGGRWRPPLRMFLYLLLGLLLTAWLGGALYRRVWRIEVDSATLVAATARVASPADGVLRELLVEDGAPVRAGQALFELDAAGVEAALERASISLAAARAEVARLEAQRAAALERLAIEARIARTRANAERRQVTLLAQRVERADAHVARVEALGRAVTPTDLDVVRGERNELAGRLEAARARLAAEQARIDAARHGYAFDGERAAAALPEADAALAAARTAVVLAERQLAAEQSRAEALRDGHAPFAGRVADVLQPAGAAVRQGTVVLVVERDEDRQVEAWLTREEAGYVRLGASARVHVPGVGRTYDALVRSIGAEAGASEQAAAVGTTPRLRVVLELQGYAGEPESRAEAMAELRSVDSVGLPAVVSLPRSWR